MGKNYHYGNQITKGFGQWLRELRKAKYLNLDDAAKGLGLEGASRVSYLSQIEREKKPAPWKLVVNIPSFYGVSDEEVLQRAYSPQLHLPILNSVLKGQALSQSINHFLDEVAIKFDEEEKEKLEDYAKLLLLRREHKYR